MKLEIFSNALEIISRNENNLLGSVRFSERVEAGLGFFFQIKAVISLFP